MSKAAQEAERTLASGLCDMTKLANASADEIRASLSALGVTVLEVNHAVASNLTCCSTVVLPSCSDLHAF